MPDPIKTRSEMAGDLEVKAVQQLTDEAYGNDMAALTFASLAIAQRIAALTDKLEEVLGEDAITDVLDHQAANHEN